VFPSPAAVAARHLLDMQIRPVVSAYHHYYLLALLAAMVAAMGAVVEVVESHGGRKDMVDKGNSGLVFCSEVGDIASTLSQIETGLVAVIVGAAAALAAVVEDVE